MPSVGARAPRSSSQMSNIFQGRTILFVDDESSVRFYLSEVILAISEGVNVLEAENGQQALEIVTRTKPDLVFLDIHMPVMTGYEFLQRFREDPANAAIPVLVLTALASTDTAIEVFESGGDGFLAKPVNRLEVLARAQALLRRREHDEILNRKIDQLESDLETSLKSIHSLRLAIKLRYGSDELEELLAEMTKGS